MVFKSFSSKLSIRILLLMLNVGLAITLLLLYGMWPITLALGLVLLPQILELHYFVNNTNHKLTLFLDSVHYSDFATTFTVDDSLGNSFKGLNKSFNAVLGAFKEARVSTQENLQYLHMIVDHVDTGLISFDEKGKVELINGIASTLLGVRKIRDMKELQEANPSLYQTIWDMPVGKREMFQVNEDIQLSIRASQFTKRGQFVKIIAIQNIQYELNSKELESWQNLLRVLRHEIMNSMTPISSLASTMGMILAEDLVKKGANYEMSDGVYQDINDSLSTIESRSKGLITFLKSYQEYTSLPSPKLSVSSVQNMLSNTENLMKTQFSNSDVELICDCPPKDFELLIDEQQMEQVLINLVKNATEAFDNQEVKTVVLRAYQKYQYKVIEIEDNGPGIIPEALDKIFVPFFTTKKTGSGIGLSLSRQLVRMNGGRLSVSSTPNEKTVFKIIFS